MKDLFQSSGVNSAGRFAELDAARGIAILMMIVFHTVFDLYFFNIYPVNVSGGFWRYFAFSTASLFLLVAGGHERRRLVAHVVWHVLGQL